MFKRIVSLCMAVVLMMTMLPITTKAEGNTAETDLNAVTVEGSNSLGALMSESIQQAYEAEMEPGAYSIMGIEIAGNTAVVEYGCVEEAIVVVALYSEENNQMLCSAKAEADPDASEVMVTFEGEMPASFLTSVYMVDKFDYSPPCVLPMRHLCIPRRCRN